MDQPEKEIRTCPTCNKELTDWRRRYCSDECVPEEPANGQQPRVSKRGVVNEGRPTKATPARIKAILDDIALGLTQEQACALHGVDVTNWIRWKNDTQRFPELRAQAEARRIKILLKRKQELADKHLDWKEPAWDLERNHNFRDQFADPAKVALQLNQQINNLVLTEADLAEARRILDSAKALPYRSGNGEVAHTTQGGKDD
jgi:hypothetical protein